MKQSEVYQDFDVSSLASCCIYTYVHIDIVFLENHVLKPYAPSTMLDDMEYHIVLKTQTQCHICVTHIQVNISSIASHIADLFQSWSAVLRKRIHYPFVLCTSDHKCNLRTTKLQMDALGLSHSCKEFLDDKNIRQQSTYTLIIGNTLFCRKMFSKRLYCDALIGVNFYTIPVTMNSFSF